MKTDFQTTNFVLYGSQTSEYSSQIYQQILNQLKKIVSKSDIKFVLTNPENLDKDLMTLDGPSYFFPLFLMDGVEYNSFKNKIEKDFFYEKEIALPLSEYPRFLKKLFIDSPKSIYLMHGSKKYNNAQKHAKIIEFGKSAGDHHFCFLEGEPYFKTFIENQLMENKTIRITPLFFITGQHIQNDLVKNILKSYDQSKWFLSKSLLERPEIVETIIEIAALELQS